MKPLKIKQKIVVKKSKKPAKGKLRISKGLPSFNVKSKPDTKTVQDDNLPSDNDEHDDFGELPCDTLLAFQSLQANSEGLHIPLLGGRFSQAILETQLFQRFDENHGSTIMQELLELIQNGQLVKISCQDEGQTALITSDDYIGAIWDAHQSHLLDCREEDKRIRPEILTWFVGCLKEWKEPTISEESMETCWKEDITVESNSDQAPSTISFRDALLSLLRLHVLMKVPITSMASQSHYRLWLPQWGLVLKQWDKARRSMMACINRSSGGEISKKNLLDFNRHSHVSTQFLLNDLVSKGKVRIIERPFGKFVRRVVDE